MLEIEGWGVETCSDGDVGLAKILRALAGADIICPDVGPNGF